MSVDLQLLKKYEQTIEELRGIALTTQQLKSRLLEIEKTLKELEKSEEDYVFKAMGNILFRTTKEEVIKELNDEKEVIEIKLKEFERKEKLLRERAKSLERQLKSRSQGQLTGAG